MISSEDCWLYAGTLTPDGYGRIVVRLDGKLRGFYAHRAMYEQYVKIIPSGLEIDHLCGVRRCINPLHLEAVTHAENIRRVVSLNQSCPKGHPYSGDNLLIEASTGYRRCRECRKRDWRKLNDRRKLERAL